MSGKTPGDADAKAASAKDGDGKTPRIAPLAGDSEGKDTAGEEPTRGKTGGGGGGGRWSGGSDEAAGEGGKMSLASESSRPTASPPPASDGQGSRSLKKDDVASKEVMSTDPFMHPI